MRNAAESRMGCHARRAGAGWLVFLWMICTSLVGCLGSVAGNQPPTAEDQDVATALDTAVVITLAASDLDAGDTLTYTIVTLPAGGTLRDPLGGDIAAVPHVLAGGGNSVRYTPNSGSSGEDTFDFRANDGSVDSNDATVSITIGTAPPADAIIDEDTTVESLEIADGTETQLRSGAKLTVTGDARIDGTLSSLDGLLVLEVTGDLTIEGTLRALHSADPELMDDASFNDQPVGIYIIVGDGAVTIGTNAVLETHGHIVVTDDASVLEGTPGDAFDEVEDVGSNDLATLVPLPPDHDAFDEAAPKLVPPGVFRVLQPALPPVTVMGNWPPAGMAPPPGDRPVWIFRFNGERDLVLDNWTVNGPAAPNGDADDSTDDAGESASGGNGKNGLRLNIFNNGGAINITNTVTLNLADGGDGGSATSACASATGGNGGSSGNFRMTARNGISLTGGTLIINPGQSGSGGDATVTQGAAGAAGCPGAAGADATATGGTGADNRKRIFVRGNVTGLTNLTIGDLIAGDGGDATAEACDGGNGIACCDGGPGGSATATGGGGGEASLNVGGLPINTSDALGGDGGEATATGGEGGNGGNCKFGDGGDGGDGGSAVATGGAGGNATNNGNGTSVGGDSGPAAGTGGNGGSGGDSGFGVPGAGGGAGGGSASTGAAGTGASDGAAGDTTGDPGADGANGGVLGGIVVFCIPLGGLVMDLPEGPIPPGMREGPVNNSDNTAQVGTITFNLPDLESENYQKGTNPIDHIGIGNGYLEINVASLDLGATQAGVVGGLRIEPLSTFGNVVANPMRVQALDADGNLIDEREIPEIPNNFGNPNNAEAIEVTLNVEQSVDRFRIVVADGTFVTFLRIYLLDP